MIEKSIFQKYFAVDALAGAYPLYASDEKVACVSLGEDFKVKVWRGRRRYMLPKCDFTKFPILERTSKFEEFVIDLFVESARCNHNFYDSFSEVYDHYTYSDLPLGRVLIPSTGDMIERIGKYAILTNFLSIDKTNLLTDVAIFVPPPEFVGVIAVSDNYYSIGVINSRGICVLK